jgi:hypothetical protein
MLHFCAMPFRLEMLTSRSNSPFTRFEESVSGSTRLDNGTAITVPSLLSLSVMVAEQREQSQKYSLVGKLHVLRAGSFSRRNSLPSERYRNECSHDGLQHLSSLSYAES